MKISAPVLFYSVLLLITTSVVAQSNQKVGSFRSINQVGILDGEHGTSFQINTINGARYKTWFAGVGVGLDYYYFRTIPLFLDLRKGFHLGAGQIFVFADPGMHFAWLTDQQKVVLGDSRQLDNISNGFYINGGLGYSLRFKSGVEWLLSAAYSYKQTTGKQQMPFCPFNGPCYISVNDYSYGMNRLSVTTGIAF